MDDWRTACLENYAEHCWMTLSVPTDDEADAWLAAWEEQETEAAPYLSGSRERVLAHERMRRCCGGEE